MHRCEAALRTACDITTTELKRHNPQEVAKTTSSDETEGARKTKTFKKQKNCNFYKTQLGKTVEGFGLH